MADPFPGPGGCSKRCLEHLDAPPGCPENPFYRAKSNDHLKCFMEAHVLACQWDETTCEDLAIDGRLEYLRYAHENGAPWNSHTCRSAAVRGHLDCLRYAHENGCPWDEETCLYATIHGHLDCLRYAHENGCPWNEGTCTTASYGGHLNCLRYAHENGCPWDSHTVLFASYAGKLNSLIYALKNGCPSDLSMVPPHIRHRLIHRSAIPILYHHQVPLPEECASHLRNHIRNHIRRARLTLRCAVRWLREYHEACSRVYAPTGVGYHEAEISFQNMVSRQPLQPCSPIGDLIDNDPSPRIIIGHVFTS